MQCFAVLALLGFAPQMPQTVSVGIVGPIQDDSVSIEWRTRRVWVSVPFEGEAKITDKTEWSDWEPIPRVVRNEEGKSAKAVAMKEKVVRALKGGRAFAVEFVLSERLPTTREAGGFIQTGCDFRAVRIVKGQRTVSPVEFSVVNGNLDENELTELE